MKHITQGTETIAWIQGIGYIRGTRPRGTEGGAQACRTARPMEMVEMADGVGGRLLRTRRAKILEAGGDEEVACMVGREVESDVAGGL